MLGELQRDFTTADATSPAGDVGGDLKYSLRPSLTLDITVNTDFAQVSHELPNRSHVGGIFINRAATGDLAGEGERWNRTYGFNGRWGIGQYGEVSGFAAGTDTPGIEGDDYAYRVGTGYSSPAWRLSGEYTEVGEGFNAEVGFLRRTAYRRPSALVSYTCRPRGFLGHQEVRPHVFYRGYWKPDGFQESGRLHVSSNREWKNSWAGHRGVNLTREGVLEAFEIVEGVVVPTGAYEHTEAQIDFRTDLSAPLGYSVRLDAGGFFGGDRVSLTQNLKWRIGDRFIADTEWEYNDVRLPGGDFIANRLRLRLSYTFTPSTYLQALLQYSDVETDFWSTNVRFGWLHRGGTGLFLVYKETRESDDVVSAFGVRDRSFTIKFSRLFDLLR